MAATCAFLPPPSPSLPSSKWRRLLRTTCVAAPSGGGKKQGICSSISRADGGGGGQRLVTTLLIDNYDSYTYNIYQELAVVNGVPPVVVQNDEWTWEYVQHQLYVEKAFDNIVISPGPGSPACPADIGVCLQVLLECKDIPILGVCLGHQALGFAHGAQIIHAPEPIHGRLSEIVHSGSTIFKGIPSGSESGFSVVRYHSLVLDHNSLPKELLPLAWTTSMDTLSFQNQSGNLIYHAPHNKKNQLPLEDHFVEVVNRTSSESTRILMGIRHFQCPHYGVQFHPESIATCHGRKIFENFKELTVNHGLRSSAHPKRKLQVPHMQEKQGKVVDSSLLLDKLNNESYFHNGVAGLHKIMDTKHLKLQWRKFDGLANQVGCPGNIFTKLFGNQNGKDTFWLDSSSTEMGRARFSFMGGKGGHLWKQITFWLSDQRFRHGGYLTIKDAKGSEQKTYLKDGFLEFLNKELLSFCYDKEDYEGLPFDFYSGFVGFIGYNMKIESGALFNNHKSRAPDACFFFADNLVVIDHSNDDVYILSIYDTFHPLGLQERLSKKHWLEETEKKLLGLRSLTTKKLDKPKTQISPYRSFKPTFVVEKSRYQYVKDVEKCLQLIRDGESYELCLTTQLKTTVKDVNPLRLYLDLRNRNPAPYAAWLNFSMENLSICSSSPERFLQLDGNGILEAKPIKGTIARGITLEEDEHLRLQLQHSEKDQAENLMIVDLLRNDLGRVCEPGTVHVPRLMEVESYATVHTLVSTVQGKKNPNLTPIDCVKAAFPGGSMTGAPKLRSMELLDSIECSSRGVYSGSIGYFSYNQTFDLNIVIRTIVIHDSEVSVGAGGAVVALSNPEDEYDEMMLKAKAPTRAVERHLNKLDSCDRRFFIAK